MDETPNAEAVAAQVDRVVRPLDWDIDGPHDANCHSRMRTTYKVWDEIIDGKRCFFWEARGGWWDGAQTVRVPCDSMEAGKAACQKHFAEQVLELLA